MMKSRAHVFISGRVQGVFFRSETRKKANSLGVTGWVKNLMDGRVEAVFEGEKSKLEKMLEFCRKGPPAALVSDVKVNWSDYKGDLSGFDIRWR